MSRPVDKLPPAPELLKKYFRPEMLPTIFCAGCGIGIVLKYTLWAVDELGIDKDKVVWVSGIGCTSRVPSYVDFDGLHTTHGRALAFATGIKLANPELKVIAFMGDGDAAAIGGNHLIHAARRNLDVATIVVNNFNYGMTGGQVAPTTPTGFRCTSAPYGSFERPLDLCAVVAAAGANYVARWTVLDYASVVKSVKKALTKRGFSFVEVLAPCPTYFGRLNGMGKPSELLKWLRSATVPLARAKAGGKDAEGKIPIGEFVDKDEPGLVEAYAEYAKRAAKA